MTTYLTTFAEKKHIMNTTTIKQTGIRLPESLIRRLKSKANKKGVSFNAYVESVLQNDVKDEIPYMDANAPIDPEILSMAGTIPAPTSQELEEDPRLAAIYNL